MNKNSILIQFSKYLKMLISGFLVIAGISISYFITYSNYKIYNNFLNEIKLEEEKISVLDKRISQLDKIKRISSTIESTDILSRQAVPSEVEIPIVMSLIQKLATDSNLKIGKLTYSGSFYSKYDSTTPSVSTEVAGNAIAGITNDPSKEVGDAKVVKDDAIKIQGSVSGNIETFITFLKSLETSRKLLEVSNVSYGITKNSSDDKSVSVELKFVVSSFYKDFSNFFATAPLQIDFDKYKDLVFKLNNYKYVEVDLSRIDVGKLDPFSNTKSNDSTNINSSTNKSFSPADENSPNINVVELEGTDLIAPTNSAVDVEASPTTDVTGTLMDILKQEGANQ